MLYEAVQATEGRCGRPSGGEWPVESADAGADRNDRQARGAKSPPVCREGWHRERNEVLHSSFLLIFVEILLLSYRTVFNFAQTLQSTSVYAQST